LGPEESGLADEPLGVRGLGLVFLGHGCTGSFGVGCVWWLGPALTKRLVWVSGLGVLFPWFGCLYWQVVVWGWLSCPYFENCIVDASIFL
jgi:hypothetical protein